MPSGVSNFNLSRRLTRSISSTHARLSALTHRGFFFLSFYSLTLFPLRYWLVIKMDNQIRIDLTSQKANDSSRSGGGEIVFFKRCLSKESELWIDELANHTAAILCCRAQLSGWDEIDLIVDLPFFLSYFNIRDQLAQSIQNSPRQLHQYRVREVCYNNDPTGRREVKRNAPFRSPVIYK